MSYETGLSHEVSKQEFHPEYPATKLQELKIGKQSEVSTVAFDTEDERIASGEVHDLGEIGKYGSLAAESFKQLAIEAGFRDDKDLGKLLQAMASKDSSYSH